MNNIKKLYQEALDNNVDIVDRHFKNDNIKGLYCDGTIALKSDLISSSEKTCVLAEELGHHNTTVGNIIDQNSIENRKQEQQARMWAYNRLIGLMEIIRAYKRGCRNIYEMAKYLEVIEDFLNEALKRYRSKYGKSTKIDSYMIIFEPQLAVLEIKEYL